MALLLFDFPERFIASDEPVLASLDDVGWIGAARSAASVREAPVPTDACLFVRGWAAAPGGDAPARAVVVWIDRRHVYEAVVGAPRPDVASAYGRPGLAGAGFEAVIPVGRLAPGRHELRIAILDPDAKTFGEAGDAVPFTIEGGDALPAGVPVRDEPFALTVDELADDATRRPLNHANGVVTLPRGGTLFVRGWCHDARELKPVHALYCTIDDRRVFRATTGLHRPDIAEALHAEDLAASGFVLRIPTTAFPPGRYALRFVALTAEGAELARSPVELTLVVGAATGATAPLAEMTAARIDAAIRVEGAAARQVIRPLTVVRGDRVFVRGWAIDEPARALAGGVMLVLDDREEIEALYGAERPDVAEHFGDPALAGCGFTAAIPTDDLAAGPHTVRCRVLAADGRGYLETAQRFDFELAETG